MIALNSLDKIRGDASSATKVDYTLHGVTSDILTQLADGQLGTSEADLYTATYDGTIVTTIIMVNTHTSAITCNLYLKPSGGTSRRIIPKDMGIGIGHVLTFDGVNLAVTNPQGNVVFYAEGDITATPSGYAHLMRQADNTLTVPLIDSDRHQQIDIVELPADVAVAEGGALGKGVLLQGDDGTDRTNILVDAAGHLQVDVLSGSDLNDSVTTEGVAATKGTQVSLDDGVDSHYAQANAAGDLKVTLDSEAVVLGAGTAAIGKLAANSGVDIGDVDVTSLPALSAGNNNIGDVDIASLPNKLAIWTQIVVSIGAATTTELVAASAGHTYTVIGVSLTIAAENNLTWKSNTTALSGPMDFGGSGESHGWQANFWPHGLKCATGEALKLTTSTTGQVSGFVMILDES